MRLYKKFATVKEVTFENEHYQIIKTVETEFPAISFKAFVKPLKTGDRILLNTTATELGLGTGGYDFVMSCLQDEPFSFEDENCSHIMKLNYTPCQFSTPFLEETNEFDVALEMHRKEGKLKSKVIVITIHSHLIPLLLGLKESFRNSKTAVIVDDSSSLPVLISDALSFCKNEGLLQATISCGNSFGADYESLNLASAMIFASFALDAEFVIITPGFGIKGSGKKFGHSAIRQAEALFYAQSLKSFSCLVPRVSGADSRKRHRGVSHHTLEILELKREGFFLPVFRFEDFDPIAATEGAESLMESRAVLELEACRKELEERLNCRDRLISMGRKYEQDPHFFLTPFACGYYWEVVEREADKKRAEV